MIDGFPEWETPHNLYEIFGGNQQVFNCSGKQKKFVALTIGFFLYRFFNISSYFHDTIIQGTVKQSDD